MRWNDWSRSSECAPVDRRWFLNDRGYAANREQAMADFKAAWERKP
jgi:hypothetical protein